MKKLFLLLGLLPGLLFADEFSDYVDARPNANAADLVRALNAPVVTGSATNNIARPSFAKEVAFVTLITAYVNPADLQALPDETAREDALTEAFDTAEDNAPNAKAARVVLKDVLKAQTLRAQYARQGGAMDDPFFGSPVRQVVSATYGPSLSEQWLGRSVTRRDVLQVR